MRRWIAIALLITASCTLTGCMGDELSLNWNITERVGNMELSTNKETGHAFVSEVYVPELAPQEITIPDEWEGHPITQLGGIFGRGVECPFMFCVEGESKNADMNSIGFYSSLPDGDVIEIPITLHLGANLQKIENVVMNDYYYFGAYSNDPKTYYHFYVNVICDPANPYFYSEDGKLYKKSSNTLVPDFVHAP